MAQVTIYLDDDTLLTVKSDSQAAGMSASQWIAEAIRDRMKKQWPASVRALAGAWSDFPTLPEIRQYEGVDGQREQL